MPAAGEEAGREDAAGPRRHLLRQQRQRGQRPRDHDGAALHRQPRRDRAAQRLPRRLAVQRWRSLAQHLEVPAAAAGRRPSRGDPDPYRSPFAGTPEEIATQERRRHPRPDPLRDARARSPRSSPSRSRASAARRTARRTISARRTPIVREHGGLCIADEVQTGFGRTGDHYWGFENFGRRARHRHDGQGHRQRRAARGGHDPARDRARR